MSRLTPVRRRVLEAVLRHNGLTDDPKQGKGSHRWFGHPDGPLRFTTIPDRDEISKDLLIRILRQVGKTREQYQKRLREV